MEPSALRLMRKTHLQPIALRPGGNLTQILSKEGALNGEGLKTQNGETQMGNTDSESHKMGIILCGIELKSGGYIHRGGCTTLPTGDSSAVQWCNYESTAVHQGCGQYQ